VQRLMEREGIWCRYSRKRKSRANVDAGPVGVPRLWNRVAIYSSASSSLSEEKPLPGQTSTGRRSAGMREGVEPRIWPDTCPSFRSAAGRWGMACRRKISMRRDGKEGGRDIVTLGSGKASETGSLIPVSRAIGLTRREGKDRRENDASFERLARKAAYQGTNVERPSL